MLNKLKRLIIKFLAPFKRMGLINRDFTIISNNCYGGITSRNFGLPYNSPTCGCFFFSKEYIKFLKDLEAHVNAELVEVKVENSKYKEYLMQKFGNNIVIGKVLDSEIVFLHYKNFDEAKEKWDRRKERINYNNLIIKFNDQNKFEIEDFYEFEKLPYKNKLFFTSNKQLDDNNIFVKIVYFRCYEKQGYVVDDIKSSKKYFNIKKYLNEIKLK